MSIKDIIEEEAANARANKDADFPSDAEGKHRNRAHVLTVRLSDEQMTALTARAAEKGLPVSTTARALISESLEHQETDFEAVIRATIKPEFLRAS